MLFVCHPRCSTCQKARKWLEAKAIAYEERDITTQNPSAEELALWFKRSGLPISRLFNTSGTKYRELGLKEKVTTASESELLALLATDGMLVKRPILVTDEAVCFGFREAEWIKALGL